MSNSLKTFWLKKSKILFLVCFIYNLKNIYWKLSELLIFSHFLFFGERCEWFAHDRSFPLSDVSKSLRSLTKNERCERIAQVAHQKWVTMSISLTSLRGNEQLWANCSGCSPKMSEWVNCSFFLVNCSFANFWPKNEWFTRKTDERILSPAFTIVGHVRRPLLEKRGGNISYLCRQTCVAFMYRRRE